MHGEQGLLRRALIKGSCKTWNKIRTSVIFVWKLPRGVQVKQSRGLFGVWILGMPGPPPGSSGSLEVSTNRFRFQVQDSLTKLLNQSGHIKHYVNTDKVLDDCCELASAGKGASHRLAAFGENLEKMFTSSQERCCGLCGLCGCRAF
jgi:hypothetical protein